MKDTQMKIQHPHVPRGLRSSSQVTQAQDLETRLLQASCPQKSSCLGFSLATKPDLCCQNSALSVVRISLTSLLEFPLLQDSWTFQTFPDYSQPHPPLPRPSSRQWIWPHKIPHGPQTCHVLFGFCLLQPLLRKAIPFPHLDLWQPCWSLKDQLECLLLQEASLNM